MNINQTKRVSMILAASVLVFAFIGTITYTNFKINIIHYTTPVIVGFAMLCVLSGVLYRFFFRFLEQNPIHFSFGQQGSLSPVLVPTTPQIPEPPAIAQQCTETTNNERVATSSNKHSFLDDYEEMQEQLQKKEAQRRIDAMKAVCEYTVNVTAGYLSKEALATLLSNIKHLACKQAEKCVALRSNIDKALKSPDLRHLAWNLGERLGATIEERALFIKNSFPIELKDASIEYLVKNLRDLVPSKIPIDVPDKGDYSFHYKEIP